MTVYLDTSAALEVVVDEPESEALRDWLSELDDELAASWLLHTELHCAAASRPEAVDAEVVEELLQRVLLVDVRRSDIRSAPVQGLGLRTLDALHLVTAVRIGATSIATYDLRLAAAAGRRGITAVSPS